MMAAHDWPAGSRVRLGGAQRRRARGRARRAGRRKPEADSANKWPRTAQISHASGRSDTDKQAGWQADLVEEVKVERPQLVGRPAGGQLAGARVASQ
jgi:hypothetical protein